MSSLEDGLDWLRERFTKEPLAQWLGAELVELRSGFASIRVPVKAEFLIVEGIVQGGITSVVADYAAVYAAMTRFTDEKMRALAHNININLLRPIGAGEVMLAEATVSGETRGSSVVTVSVFGSKDQSCVFAMKAVGTVLFTNKTTS